jgi:hypothetical protein
MDPKILAGRRENPWTVVALWGDAINADFARRLFGVARNVIESAGLELNIMGVHTSEKYSKYYKRCTPRLLKSMNKENVIGFSAAHVPSADTDVSRFGWIQVSASRHDWVLSGRTALLSRTSTSIIPIIKQVAAVYPVRYGFSYVIDKFYGPFFHAVGMFFGPASNPSLPPLSGTEKKRTGDWSRASDAVKISGILRDVFPLNVLSEIHRTKRVNGVALFDWIGQDDSRGRIEQITPTLWAWHVPEDRCVQLGDQLEAAGLYLPPPPRLTPEQQARELEQFLKSAGLVGPGTLVKRPGDKDWAEAQSPRGQARINSGIRRIRTPKRGEATS